MALSSMLQFSLVVRMGRYRSLKEQNAARLMSPYYILNFRHYLNTFVNICRRV